MLIYAVTWSRAIGGDEIPTDCFCGCAGTFTSLARAKVYETGCCEHYS